MVIWVLDHGVPGHSAQTEGALELLENECLVSKVNYLKFDVTLRGWMRLPAKLSLSLLPAKSALKLALSFHKGISLPNEKPDLIIGSGGTSLWLLYSLGRRFKIKTLYIGYPEGFPSYWYNVVLSPLPKPGISNLVESPRIITAIRPSKIAEDVDDAGFPIREKKLVAVLIGGKSRSHHFEAKDWKNLAEGLNILGEKGFRFVLTTSRRTGTNAERILKNIIKTDFLKDVVWWSETPQKKVSVFLGRSDRVLVTRDSLTMVSEAIDSGRPTCAIYPDKVFLGKSSFFSNYFIKLEKNGFIKSYHSKEIPLLDEKSFILTGKNSSAYKEKLINLLLNN